MKRISDFIAEELAAAFEAAGYDRNIVEPPGSLRVSV